jgi:hypothetical protein
MYNDVIYQIGSNKPQGDGITITDSFKVYGQVSRSPNIDYSGYVNILSNKLAPMWLCRVGGVSTNSASPPSAPRNLQVAEDGSNWVFTWQAPLSAGSSPITIYEAVVFLDGVEEAGSGSLGNVLTWTYAFPEFQHQEITVKVRCTNGLVSPYSNGVTFTPGGPLSNFHPDQLANYALDIDPQLSTTADENNLVSIVEDVSPNEYNAQPSGDTSTYPLALFNENGLNGQTVIYCASGKNLVIPSGFLSSVYNEVPLPDATIYILMKYAGTGSYVTLFDSDPNIGTREFTIFVNSGAGTASWFGFGQATASAPGGGSTGYVRNQWLIIAVTITDEQAVVHVNGTIDNTYNSSNVFSKGINLGGNPSGGGALPDAHYARILGYTESHDTTNRQKVEGYLAHTFGLTANLPADHPYKTTPP